MFIYKVVNTHKPGICQVCNWKTAQMHYQMEARVYEDEEGERAFSNVGCVNLAGHKDCLERKQKQHKKVEAVGALFV